LPNLLLTFPNLSADEFCLVDDQEAVAAGLNRREFAARQAICGARVADWPRVRSASNGCALRPEFAVYTPGSRAGLPVNALGSFAPPAAVAMTGIFCVNAL